ncbi:hypothetical protein FQN54_003966 [Arachnomyces sp. PD_36]|nr:hypothetical protein FQN54_003966 [Arachnomyces sp. PD_36]
MEVAVSLHILSLLLFLSHVSALPAAQCSNQTAKGTARTARAVYFLTNDCSNSVVALKVNNDGTLSDGSITPTDGAGGNGFDVAKNQSSAPDALFSQGALKVAGNSLVAVNAGSNTLSMFNIDAADPTKLTAVGEPVDTMGEFPVSVDISTKLSQACVANGGAQAGVACFSMDTQAGLQPLDCKARQFNINQSTPPVGPEGTVSHTFFNSDETALLTTVKGNPATGDPGFLSMFPIENGQVSMQDVQSSPNGTAVLFGSTNIPGTSNILATDASFGGAVINIDGSGQGQVVAMAEIGNQKATCWATFSESTGTAFVTDVGVNHVVEIDPSDGTILQETTLTNGNPGLIDLQAAGDFVYALSPGDGTVAPAVTVLDVSGGPGSAKEIQNFNPQGAISANAMGMTVFMG